VSFRFLVLVALLREVLALVTLGVLEKNAAAALWVDVLHAKLAPVHFEHRGRGSLVVLVPHNHGAAIVGEVEDRWPLGVVDGVTFHPARSSRVQRTSARARQGVAVRFHSPAVTGGVAHKCA
jgi:hypothetical protein